MGVRGQRSEVTPSPLPLRSKVSGRSEGKVEVESISVQRERSDDELLKETEPWGGGGVSLAVEGPDRGLNPVHTPRGSSEDPGPNLLTLWPNRSFIPSRPGLLV